MNLFEPASAMFSPWTIPQTMERYLKLFAADDLANEVSHRVTPD